MYYPLKFEPIYKQIIWGGNKLEKLYNRNLPFSNTGESWDVSCRKDDMGIICNGTYSGKTIKEIVFSEQLNFLGTKISKQDEFPLLIKLIDANDNLSVQVHPNDDYSKKYENYEFGKSEMWYILDAPQNSFLIVGTLENTTKESFKEATEKGTVEECLNKLYIKNGDVINIQPGVIHAITKGVVLAEIQQNSDITYRIYDYNRAGIDGKPRELHVEKAMDVIDFDKNKSIKQVNGLIVSKNDNKLTYYIANKYFAVIKYEIKTKLTENSDEERFFIFTCIQGNATIESENFSEQVNIGDSIFIPAGLGRYTIVGNCILLKSFVPDIEKNFISPLLEEEITINEINNETSIDTDYSA
jgi:mannose-6-phosphate isomerase